MYTFVYTKYTLVYFYHAKTSPVANGIGAQIRPVVSHPDHNGGAAILGATRLTEIDPDQLDHVGLKEVHIPGKTAIFSKS